VWRSVEECGGVWSLCVGGGCSLVTGDEGAREVEGVPALVHHTLDAVRVWRGLGVDVSHRSGSHGLGPPLPQHRNEQYSTVQAQCTCSTEKVITLYANTLQPRQTVAKQGAGGWELGAGILRGYECGYGHTSSVATPASMASGCSSGSSPWMFTHDIEPLPQPLHHLRTPLPTLQAVGRAAMQARGRVSWGQRKKEGRKGKKQGEAPEAPECQRYVVIARRRGEELTVLAGG